MRALYFSSEQYLGSDLKHSCKLYTSVSIFLYRVVRYYSVQCYMSCENHSNICENAFEFIQNNSECSLFANLSKTKGKLFFLIFMKNFCFPAKKNFFFDIMQYLIRHTMPVKRRRLFSHSNRTLSAYGCLICFRVSIFLF